MAWGDNGYVINEIGTDPDTLRSCAEELRDLAFDLETAWFACNGLTQIAEGLSWKGEAQQAYAASVGENPKGSDIDNIQATFRESADVLDGLATKLTDVQSTLDWCRTRLDDLDIQTNNGVADDYIDPGVRAEAEAIVADAEAARDEWMEARDAAAETFEALCQTPTYAKAPGSPEWDEYWARRSPMFMGLSMENLAGAWDGIVETVTGAWDLGEWWFTTPGMTLTEKMLNDPEVTNAIIAMNQARKDNPGAVWESGSFWNETALAMIDWELLKENPQRWFGQLIPGIVIGAFTGGFGAAAAVTARVATVAARLPRMARIADNLAGISTAFRATDNVTNVFVTVPALRPVGAFFDEVTDMVMTPVHNATAASLTAIGALGRNIASEMVDLTNNLTGRHHDLDIDFDGASVDLTNAVGVLPLPAGLRVPDTIPAGMSNGADGSVGTNPVLVSGTTSANLNLAPANLNVAPANVGGSVPTTGGSPGHIPTTSIDTSAGGSGGGHTPVGTTTGATDSGKGLGGTPYDGTGSHPSTDTANPKSLDTDGDGVAEPADIPASDSDPSVHAPEGDAGATDSTITTVDDAATTPDLTVDPSSSDVANGDIAIGSYNNAGASPATPHPATNSTHAASATTPGSNDHAEPDDDLAAWEEEFSPSHDGAHAQETLAHMEDDLASGGGCSSTDADSDLPPVTGPIGNGAVDNAGAEVVHEPAGADLVEPVDDGADVDADLADAAVASAAYLTPTAFMPGGDLSPTAFNPPRTFSAHSGNGNSQGNGDSDNDATDSVQPIHVAQSDDATPPPADVGGNKPPVTPPPTNVGPGSDWDDDSWDISGWEETSRDEGGDVDLDADERPDPAHYHEEPYPRPWNYIAPRWPNPTGSDSVNHPGEGADGSDAGEADSTYGTDADDQDDGDADFSYFDNAEQFELDAYYGRGTVPEDYEDGPFDDTALGGTTNDTILPGEVDSDYDFSRTTDSDPTETDTDTDASTDDEDELEVGVTALAPEPGDPDDPFDGARFRDAARDIEASADEIAAATPEDLAAAADLERRATFGTAEDLDKLNELLHKNYDDQQNLIAQIENVDPEDIDYDFDDDEDDDDGSSTAVSPDGPDDHTDDDSGAGTPEPDATDEIEQRWPTASNRAWQDNYGADELSWGDYGRGENESDPPANPAGNAWDNTRVDADFEPDPGRRNLPIVPKDPPPTPDPDPNNDLSRPPEAVEPSDTTSSSDVDSDGDTDGTAGAIAEDPDRVAEALRQYFQAKTGQPDPPEHLVDELNKLLGDGDASSDDAGGNGDDVDGDDQSATDPSDEIKQQFVDNTDADADIEMDEDLEDANSEVDASWRMHEQDYEQQLDIDDDPAADPDVAPEDFPNRGLDRPRTRAEAQEARVSVNGAEDPDLETFGDDDPDLDTAADTDLSELEGDLLSDPNKPVPTKRSEWIEHLSNNNADLEGAPDGVPATPPADRLGDDGGPDSDPDDDGTATPAQPTNPDDHTDDDSSAATPEPDDDTNETGTTSQGDTTDTDGGNGDREATGGNEPFEEGDRWENLTQLTNEGDPWGNLTTLNADHTGDVDAATDLDTHDPDSAENVEEHNHPADGTADDSTHADPGPGTVDTTFAWLKDINPSGDRDNCGPSAAAVDRRLAGDTTAAAPPSVPDFYSYKQYLEWQTGRQFQWWKTHGAGATQTSVEWTLGQHPVGEGFPTPKGILFRLPPYGSNELGHFFNATPVNGTVRYLDGVSGKEADASSWGDHFTDFIFMDTTGVDYGLDGNIPGGDNLPSAATTPDGIVVSPMGDDIGPAGGTTENGSTEPEPFAAEPDAYDNLTTIVEPTDSADHHDIPGQVCDTSTWREAQGQLTPAQADALRKYADTEHLQITGYLRTNHRPEPPITDQVRHLDEALNIQPTTQTTKAIVAKSFKDAEGLLDPSNPDGTQHFADYLTTRVGPNPAHGATRHGHVLLDLEVPPGVPAMFLDGISAVPDGRLLLRRGLTVQRTGDSYVGPDAHIYVPARVLLPDTDASTAFPPTGTPIRVGDLVTDNYLVHPEQHVLETNIRNVLADMLQGQSFGPGTHVDITNVTAFHNRTFIDGQIVHGDKVVSEVQQTLTRENGNLHVKYEYIKLDKPMRGQGLATGLVAYLENWFRASGVVSIRIDAALENGGYTWARAGFNWTNEGQARSILDDLQRDLTSADMTDAERAAVQDIVGRAHLSFDDDDFPTVGEIAEVGYTEHPGEHFGRTFLSGKRWLGEKYL